ncbi:hypothetical protein [Paenibacillus sp. NRS-1760]|uniref:hypothetical protein n=1 Tax=Paenibacillus sp. NRS-1760 TaxID=3233902 RepID=UPI003D2D2095
MIVFNDGLGTYETGDWLTVKTYPDRECYEVEEGSELAMKIVSLYPFYTMEIIDGVLVDVTPREKTQEEIDKENTPPPKTVDQLRIEQLENELALSKKSNLDTMDAVFDIYLMVLDLQAVGGEQP